MYLKALEIQGFKSFPDRTRLTFEKEITAIVGPNGSGKSNISDALLWVMGEQRSRALRGGKMEDVIFGGTEKRSPLGFAQVSLILDNSGGLFDIDTPEVTITRRYYRTGDSEYYINRESVRLRDITELLMDTGLGRDGYSVIGQGRIAEIVSAKSTDRREVFEEAAGIARYRRRKEEAERKLEGAQDNLIRINDKIDELEMQVTPLKAQAETAKKFLVLRDEQKALEISVWMETLDRLQEQSARINSDYETAKRQLEDAQSEVERLYASSENFTEKMRELDVKAERVRALRSESEAGCSETESAMAVMNARLEHNRETIERLGGEMSEQTERARQLGEQIAAQRARLAEIETEKQDAELKIAAAIESSRENAGRSGEKQKTFAALTARESALSASRTQKQTVVSMLGERLEEMKSRRGGIDGEIAEAEEKAGELEKRLAEENLSLSRVKERCDELSNVINGHRMLMGSRAQREKELSERLNTITVEKRSTEGRIKMLSDMEREYEGLGKAVKTVMREKNRGTLRGVHGPVAGLVTTDERYAIAVETALGAAMQNIVVDTQADGKAAIELLKRQDGGRATFLPIDTVRPGYLRQTPSGEEGYVGVASDIVSYDRKFENIFLNLLGRTVVAETLGDAVRMSRKFNNSLRIVTLDGQMINAGGSMTGGSSARNVGILSRANELKALRAKLSDLQREESEANESLKEASRELSKARYEQQVAETELSGASEEYHKRNMACEQVKMLLSAANEALDALDDEKRTLGRSIKESGERISSETSEIEALERELCDVGEKLRAITDENNEFERERERILQELSDHRSRLASLDTERETTERSVENLEELLAGISGDGDERRKTIESIERSSEEIKAALGEKQAELEKKRRETAAFTEQIDAITTSRLELEGKRSQAERAGQDKNRELLDLQAVCSKYEQKKLSAEMEEGQIVDKLWESYELSRTAAQQLRQPVENMPQATKRITELRREISRLGHVNIGAIEEYSRVSERYEFLTGQRDDAAKAKRELEKIITDITGEMREIFTQKFHEIDDSFRGVFLDLFGGGKASLELEDEENVLECGIEIRVQPPGKAVTTISLLSGGEKSFVAIALYFAIMKVRPTPFCIMDEIDAALDEANVIRYAEYMRLMSKNTQFIAITHHRGTMEEADMLYGVTMQEKGVSTVLAVDLEQAEKNAQ